MSGNTAPLKTVLRAFEILALLEEKHKAGPSEIAKQIGVTKATAHDYLTSLEQTGFVINEDGSYRIGYQLLGLSTRVKYRNPLFNAARAPLQKLSAEIGELVHIGVLENGEWVLVHHEGEVTTVDLGVYPGLRFPIHAHAAGKVILAYLSDERVREIVETNGLEQITEYTITDTDELLDELDDIADTGYAYDSDQVVVGVGIVAAPVLVDGEPVGSLSIACPTGRLKNIEYRENLVQHVTEAADEVSINYRYSV
ncbi:IclR family transcriptional regulator [Natrinema soli]|uniref:IclR family transcriptional regulator n=1 Tax=Natrinema soli TaxID=1930624 RepID=A0ABD5SQN5_9EURY|nr:IclR family transcriptional regulator [Natrinema soli]